MDIFMWTGGSPRMIPGLPGPPLNPCCNRAGSGWRATANRLPEYSLGKLIVVGSSAQGNNLTDRGATPLERDTLLISTYWNVANSVITGRFIHRTPLPVELGIIGFLGLAVAFLTWQLRARIIYASLTVAGLFLAYMAATFSPILPGAGGCPCYLPVSGPCSPNTALLVVYLVMIEEREKRHMKSIFSKIVSAGRRE